MASKTFEWNDIIEVARMNPPAFHLRTSIHNAPSVYIDPFYRLPIDMSKFVAFTKKKNQCQAKSTHFLYGSNRKNYLWPFVWINGSIVCRLIEIACFAKLTNCILFFFPFLFFFSHQKKKNVFRWFGFFVPSKKFL